MMPDKADNTRRKAPKRGFLFFCPGLLSVILCLWLLPAQAQERININTASAVELTRLPGIGPTLAERIVSHRHKHGPFKRPQDLIIVRGISARRYRPIAHLISI